MNSGLILLLAVAIAGGIGCLQSFVTRPCTDGEVVCDESSRRKKVSAAFNRSISTSPREWRFVEIDFLFDVGSGIPLDSPRISLARV